MVEGVDFIFNSFASLFVLLTSNIIFSSFIFVAILGLIIKLFINLRSK